MSGSVNKKEEPVIAILAAALEPDLCRSDGVDSEIDDRSCGELFIGDINCGCWCGMASGAWLSWRILLGEQIVDSLQMGTSFRCIVRYCFDGERRLGTGAAIGNAPPLSGDLLHCTIYGATAIAIPTISVLWRLPGIPEARSDDRLSKRRIDGTRATLSSATIGSLVRKVLSKTRDGLHRLWNLCVSAQAFDLAALPLALDLELRQMELVRRQSLAG